MKVGQKALCFAIAGLVATSLWATDAAAQGGMRRGRMQQGDVPGVKLTQEQRQRIAAIRGQTQDRVQTIRRDPKLTQSEKVERIQEVRRRGHEEVLSVLTPEQRRRFQDWWAGCPRAGVGPGTQIGGPGMRGGVPPGSVPGVQVTPEQRERVAAIRLETQSRVQAIRRDPNLSQQEKAERIAEARREGHERVLDVLTPEQRRQFQDWWAGCPRAGMGPRGPRGRP